MLSIISFYTSCNEKKDRYCTSFGFLSNSTNFKWMMSLSVCSNPAGSECYRVFCKTNSFYFPFYFN